jgi:hypothetical protein
MSRSKKSVLVMCVLFLGSFVIAVGAIEQGQQNPPANKNQNDAKPPADPAKQRISRQTHGSCRLMPTKQKIPLHPENSLLRRARSSISLAREIASFVTATQEQETKQTCHGCAENLRTFRTRNG